MVHSLTLQAANAYQKVLDTRQSDTKAIPNSVDFNNLVETSFNNLVKMQPAEILKHIQSYNNNNNAPSATNLSAASEAINVLRKSVTKQEKSSMFGLVNDQVSLSEIAMATVEAANTVKTFTEIRNKFQDAVDKIFNISI